MEAADRVEVFVRCGGSGLDVWKGRGSNQESSRDSLKRGKVRYPSSEN